MIRFKLCAGVRARYSTYFVHGTDYRPLRLDQQLQISQFVAEDPQSNSFFVYNNFETKDRLKQWFDTLPWIRPYYSVRANPIPPLTIDLIRGGVGMACTSRAQLKQSLEQGLRHISIIYSNPVKDQVDLKWASDNNIVLTTADSIEQLKKIKQLAPRMKVLWRIAVNHEGSRLKSKYGDEIFTEADIVKRFKQIKNMGINLEGIHFHCNPTEHQSELFRDTILHAQKCMRLGREIGHRMEIVNVGGAFQKDGVHEQSVASLELLKDDPLGYQIIAEPGRYFASNCCYLLTRVLAKRMKSGKPCYQINDSLYHAFNCILLDGVSFQNKKNMFYSKIVSPDPTTNKKQAQAKRKQPFMELDKHQDITVTRTSTVFGMTCDGLDIIANSFDVPEDLDVGDWLCFSGMGAYTYGPRTSFNGMRSISKIVRWSSKITEKAQPRS